VTVTLAVVVVVLLGLGATEIWYLQRDRTDAAVAADAPTAQMPVVLSDLETRSVVEQAAQDATAILSVSWRSYDDQVTRVSSMMTPDFARQYQSTRQDIRKPFIKQRTTVTTQIDNQGVISASPTEVDVLLYLTESTTKHGDGLTVQQFRVTVTMTRSGSGWLVAKLDTT
jgi:Mce-associated membrane protein